MKFFLYHFEYAVYKESSFETLQPKTTRPPPDGVVLSNFCTRCVLQVNVNVNLSWLMLNLHSFGFIYS